jgi:hypothetical protein
MRKYKLSEMSNLIPYQPYFPVFVKGFKRKRTTTICNYNCCHICGWYKRCRKSKKGKVHWSIEKAYRNQLKKVSK